MRILLSIILLIQCSYCIAQRLDTSYYTNGQLFSFTNDSEDDLTFLHYKLSLSGDTVNLREYDFSGNLQDFRYRSYCKNLNGEICGVNEHGTFHYYKRKGDSLYIESSRERYQSSMFFQLKRLYDIDSQHFLELDTLFIDAFNDRNNYSKEEFIDRLQNSTKELQISDSLDLLPYINIASDMLYLPWEDRRKVRDIQISNDMLLIYFKALNRKVKNVEELSYVHEYFSYQGELPKGEWLYYSGLTRFMKPRVSEHCLLNAYRYAMEWIVKVSINSIKTNNMFEHQYLKLATIIDTLGNSFKQTKKSIVGDFINSLKAEEQETLEKVSLIYEEVISDNFIRFTEDNKNKTGGLDINRIKYYKLITQWQLKFPNCRLFNQNYWKWSSNNSKRQSKMPDNFESILEKFDRYLNEENYSILVQSERSMFNSLAEIDSYTMTSFNPYFMERDKNKRKLRRFNWLVK